MSRWPAQFYEAANTAAAPAVHNLEQQGVKETHSGSERLDMRWRMNAEGEDAGTVFNQSVDRVGSLTTMTLTTSISRLTLLFAKMVSKPLLKLRPGAGPLMVRPQSATTAWQA